MKNIIFTGWWNEIGSLVSPGGYQSNGRKNNLSFKKSRNSSKMGTAGRKRIEEYFDIKKTTAKIEKIYEELLLS